ncbi:MAG: DUF3179 domain-containing (seleno)protein [Acidimicrobiales bacterium]
MSGKPTRSLLRPAAIWAVSPLLLMAAVGCSDARPVALAVPTTVAVEPEPVPVTWGVDRLATVAAVDAWLAEPTTKAALAVVEAVGVGESVDDAPYLVDLLRMSGSSEVWKATIAALGDLRGGETPPTDVNAAYVELGSWVLDQAPRPGPRYRTFKASLYGQLDERFTPLLAAIDDPSLLVTIQWGGVRLGEIRELNQPVRRPLDQMGWAVPSEIVFEVDVGGATVVYPRRVIGPHELANDSVADGAGGSLPFGVSYCSLCRTAVAFDRRVDGRELTFKTSGLLLDANKLMVDDQTESLWRQATGEAISGPLRGTRLDLLPMRAVTLGELDIDADPSVVDLPEPFILDQETGTLTGYPYTDTEPLPDYVAGGRLWFPVAGVGGEEDPLADVATVEVSGAALAVDVGALEPGARVDIDLGVARVRVEGGPAGPRFHRVEASGATVELAAGREAWFAWLARHPDTVRWPRR